MKTVRMYDGKVFNNEVSDYAKEKIMKMTVSELMEKIEAINRVIDELYKMPDREACTRALKYLDEYVDMLKDIKVDV